jgi:hypothetical protein
MNSIPNDPVMLLSYANTQLRDNFANLDDFCLALGLGKAFICDKLKAIDYSYDEKLNQFV